MKIILSLTLGIMTALGGFVDLGQIVFTMQAGALFGYSLAWTIVLGAAAIILYMEMCGRVSAVAKRPVFEVVRRHLGGPLGTFTLVCSNLLGLITCAAEIGAVAIILHLLTGWNERLLMLAGTLVIGVLIWFLKFSQIESSFGFWGLLMTLFAVAALKLGPDWGALARGMVPGAIRGEPNTVLYCYFAVGIFSAMLMEYEVHFYSSGAIEEQWTEKSLVENTVVATGGTVLGALLTCALMVLAALVFLPRGVVPNNLSSTLLPPGLPFGPIILVFLLLGILATVASAAVETSLCGGYNFCQFYDYKWGKNRPPRSVPVFTGNWIGMLVVAVLLVLSGIDPLTLVNVSIVFGMIIMPFTYYPILKASSDVKLMGEHANGPVHRIIGWIFFGLIVVAAVIALPLMVVTHGGRP